MSQRFVHRAEAGPGAPRRDGARCGHLVLGLGYPLIASSVLKAANVPPTVAGLDAGYAEGVSAAMTGGTPEGHIGTLRTLLRVQDFAHLVGGLVFRVALFRARVLARWAAVLLAFAGVITIAGSALPDPLFRLVAVPKGVELIARGSSLSRSLPAGHRPAEPEPAVVGHRAAATSHARQREVVPEIATVVAHWSSRAEGW